MDNKKVVQVLKEIFDKCGTEIVQNRKQFIGAVFDLLDEWNYKDERTVLKLAMESNAIPILVFASQITSDAAERAVEQLKKESRMTQGDAEFVVRCVVAACGFDPDIVTENNKKRRQAEEEQKRQEEAEQIRQEEQKRQEEAAKQQEEELIQEDKARLIALLVVIGILFAFACSRF